LFSGIKPPFPASLPFLLASFGIVFRALYYHCSEALLTVAVTFTAQLVICDAPAIIQEVVPFFLVAL
jgi:hypothetical protein